MLFPHDSRILIGFNIQNSLDIVIKDTNENPEPEKSVSNSPERSECLIPDSYTSERSNFGVEEGSYSPIESPENISSSHLTGIHGIPPLDENSPQGNFMGFQSFGSKTSPRQPRDASRSKMSSFDANQQFLRTQRHSVDQKVNN